MWRSAHPSPGDFDDPSLSQPQVRQGRLESLRNWDLLALPLPLGKQLPWEHDSSQQYGGGDAPSPTELASTDKLKWCHPAQNHPLSRISPFRKY